jgi:hypothetical protein
MIRFITINILISLIILPVYAKKKVAILNFESKGKVKKKAKIVTNVLFNLAKSDSSLNNSPKKDLEEMKMLYCEDSDSNKVCINKINKELKVNIIFTGLVSRIGKNIKISIYYLNNRIFKLIEIIVPKKISKSDLEMKISKVWYSSFKGTNSQIIIMSKGGDKVYIDGQFVLKTTPGKNIIPKAPTGSHVLKIKSSKNKIWTKKLFISKGSIININPGFNSKTKITKIKITKIKDPEKAKDPLPNQIDLTEKPKVDEKPASKPNYWKFAFYGTAGTATVLIAASIFTGMKVLSLEDDKDAEMASDPSLYQGVSDVCNNPATSNMKSICDDGQFMAMTTNMLIGGGIALGILSTYFLYKGFLSPSADVKGEVDSTPDSNVTILPFLSQNGGGISFSTKF